MMGEPHIPTFDELLQSIETAAQHPSDTCWDIYRFLHAHVGKESLSSAEARTILSAYMKIASPQASLIHSRMLYVALQMAEAYADFRLPAFLSLWGWPERMRPEDSEDQVDKEGKRYLSLKVRTERALQTYLLHHPEERTVDDACGILPMVAVKVFQTERDGRKVRSVKLVGPQGEELLADSHVFACKPWEIQGRLYDVLVRTSKEGNDRAQEVVPSQYDIATLFPPVTGYVERVDMEHAHYHVYDNASRHFVAEKPALRLQKGDFVRFAPIVPAKDTFKSAVVLAVLPVDEGRMSFGLHPATITYLNREKGYFAYRLTSLVPATSEGTITAEGTADLSLCPTVEKGQTVQLLLFLTRGKDGAKHNHVAQVVLP